jgi:hypothetical protein
VAAGNERDGPHRMLTFFRMVRRPMLMADGNALSCVVAKSFGSFTTPISSVHGIAAFRNVASHRTTTVVATPFQLIRAIGNSLDEISKDIRFEHLSRLTTHECTGMPNRFDV